MKKTFLSALALILCSAAFAQENGQEAEVLYNQYGQKVSASTLTAESQDGFFVVREKGGNYKLWFDARVQADAACFWGAQDWADPIGNGTSIRRARFAVKTQINKDWYGEVDMDMANGIFELKDAIVRYDGIKNTEIQIGNFKEFFSIQRNNSSRYTQFMERPMAAQAFAPSRHLGANIKWADKALWASAGVFFQEIAGAEERGYVEANNKLTSADTDEGVSYTAKFVYMPGWDKDNWGLHIAGAYSYRTPKTSNEVFGFERYSTRNSNSINRKKYLDTGDFGPVDHHQIYTAELAGYWGGFRGEAVYIGNATTTKAENIAGAGTVKNFGGWYVQGGYLLFGGQQRYDSNGAKFTRVKRGRSWGDVELCGRVEYINLNADQALWKNASYADAAKLIMGGSAWAYALGLNYYINNNVKMVLNYQYNDQDKFCSGKSNKFFCGLDEDGKPTKDPRQVNGKGGVDYQMLSFRIEIDF